MDPRLPIQKVNFETRIVRQKRQAAGSMKGFGFNQRVLQVAFTALVDFERQSKLLWGDQIQRQVVKDGSDFLALCPLLLAISTVFILCPIRRISKKITML